MILVMLTVLPLFKAPVHAQPENFNSESFKTYSTIKVEQSFDLPTNRRTIHFLLSHLDLTCAIIRGWDLEAFRARQLRPGHYRARDGAGLKGIIRELNKTDTSFSFFGKGRYQSSSLPLTLRGKALAEIGFQGSNSDTTTITGRLHVKANNTVVHLMSQVFYPLLTSLARAKTEHLTKIAKKTINKLTRHPSKTRQRLRTIDQEYARQWEDFLSRNHN